MRRVVHRSYGGNKTMKNIDISINTNGQDTLSLRIAALANEASKLAAGNANKRLLDNSFLRLFQDNRRY
jgi:hypothetical protein